MKKRHVILGIILILIGLFIINDQFNFINLAMYGITVGNIIRSAFILWPLLIIGLGAMLIIKSRIGQRILWICIAVIVLAYAVAGPFLYNWQYNKHHVNVYVPWNQGNHIQDMERYYHDRYDFDEEWEEMFEEYFDERFESDHWYYYNGSSSQKIDDEGEEIVLFKYVDSEESLV